jgi:uncharacterized protein
VDVVWLSLIGLVSGACGGLLGIGGSIVMIPAMTEFMGPQQHVYQAAALIVNFFVAGPAVVQHVRAGALDGRIVRLLIPSAAFAAILGVGFSELRVFQGSGMIYLTGMFGVFLLWIAAIQLVRLIREQRAGETSRVESGRNEHTEPPASGAVIAVGLFTGVFSGLLGIGGGVLSIPLQQRVLGVPLPRAIANSAATIVGLSVVSALAKNLAIATRHPDVNWLSPIILAGCLIPTAMIGSYVGSRLTHVLPIRAVRWAFLLLLVTAGVRMIWRIS